MASVRKDGNVSVVGQGLALMMSASAGSERQLADLLHSTVTGTAARSHYLRAYPHFRAPFSLTGGYVRCHSCTTDQ